MKTRFYFSLRNLLLIAAAALLLVITSRRASGQSLTNDLVSHWPLDVVQGTKTPDVVSGYDMDLNNLTAANLVMGYVSNCFSFVNANGTLLSRVHAPADNLPINKHAAFTISLWINATGAGQADLRFFSEANTGLSDPLFNLGTHSTAADNSVDLYFRQAGEEVAHLRTVGQPLDGTWHHFAFVQQADGSRTIYLDGVADGLAIPPKRAGITWNFNDTTIGGILRASASHWITGLIDEVALWKRPLSEAEINDVKNNGVPSIGGGTQPLEIKSFSADFAAVAQGDKVTLRWDASKDAMLSISPGVGDVTPNSQFGVGSIEVTVNQDTTFIFTATRGQEMLTKQVQIRVVTGIAPNWRLVENFEFLPLGQVLGQANFLNPEGVFSVLATETNQVMGYSDGDDLAAIRLNSLALNEGQSATLFFRLSVEDPVSTIGITLGLTERPIRFNGDFAGNIGPYIRIDRTAGAAMASISARNGVGAAYSLAPDAIEAGKVYNVWIDAENRPFDVAGGVQMGGDRYSVHLAQEGGPRTTLFSDFTADRDAVNIDPALGTPGTNLIYIFFSALDANQGTNKLLFDDFYVSSSGFNSTVPSPARSFRVPIRMTNLAFDALAGFSFSWNAIAGKTYTINRKVALNDPWFPLEIDYPAGGAVGDTATYTDLDAVFGGPGFYQVVEELQP
ncbi:MAG: LamG domain-containing protein [Verrucomicrobia subdivision 3 bacterium]|nr:LamG domain-containing protein [Limisphaerales bacterium]